MRKPDIEPCHLTNEDIEAELIAIVDSVNKIHIDLSSGERLWEDGTPLNGSEYREWRIRAKDAARHHERRAMLLRAEKKIRATKRSQEKAETKEKEAQERRAKHAAHLAEHAEKKAKFTAEWRSEKLPKPLN